MMIFDFFSQLCFLIGVCNAPVQKVSNTFYASDMWLLRSKFEQPSNYALGELGSYILRDTPEP